MSINGFDKSRSEVTVLVIQILLAEGNSSNDARSASSKLWQIGGSGFRKNARIKGMMQDGKGGIIKDKGETRLNTDLSFSNGRL